MVIVALPGLAPMASQKSVDVLHHACGFRDIHLDV